jgi:hypothetical protein
LELVCVSGARAQPLEFCQIEAVIGCGIELDGLAGDEQEGGIGGDIPDGLAQVGEGIAQAEASGQSGQKRLASCSRRWGRLASTAR